MTGNDSEIEQRRRWMGVLAKAPPAELAAAFERLAECPGGLPPCTPLRRPEIGLVMARGRAGGTGQRFNLGEITVTRCSMLAPSGHVGHGYVRGRDKRHAELAATADALLQDPTMQGALLDALIEPLARAEAARKDALRRKAAATRVEFFTLARGDG